LVKVASPPEAEAQCMLLLQQWPYHVIDTFTSRVTRVLRTLVEDRATLGSESDRTLISQDVEPIIESGRAHQGRWQPGRQWLETRAAERPIYRDVVWSDFETSRYVLRDCYAEAWHAIVHRSATVVFGPTGTGKTTVARYICYRFLTARENARAFYLPMFAGTSLSEEISFMTSRIHDDVLFIIDDHQFFRDEVERLAEAFHDFGSPTARLLVISNTTFGESQAMVFGRARSALNEFGAFVRFREDPDELGAVLEQMQARNMIHAALPAKSLAELSGGNLGLALILDDCGQSSPGASAGALVRKRKSRAAIEEAILVAIGRAGDHDFFDDEVAPALVLALYGLPVPNDFTAAVFSLIASGILQAISSQSGARPTNERLIQLLALQHRHLLPDVIQDFMTKYPESAHTLLERIADDNSSRMYLLKFCQQNLTDVADLVKNSDAPVTLYRTSVILKSVYVVSPESAGQLLDQLMVDGNHLNTRFFIEHLTIERAENARSITQFFAVLYRVNRRLTKQSAGKFLGDVQVKFLLLIFGLASTTLDDIGSCLLALARCSRDFAVGVYDRLKTERASQWLAKVQQTDSNAGGFLVWLRFCERIRLVQRSDAHMFLDAHVSPSKILEYFLQTSDFRSLTTILLRLRRLRPRAASDVLASISEFHLELVEKALLSELRLGTLAGELVAFARLNRRLALTTTRGVRNHLFDLIQTEGNHEQLGGAIRRLHIAVGWRLANEAADHLRREVVLEGLRNSGSRLGFVGRTLDTLARANEEVASWLASRIDYRIFLRTQLSLILINWTYFLSGLMTARTTSDRKAGLSMLLSDTQLTAELREGWRGCGSLIEKAACISMFLDVPLQRQEVASLLGFGNSQALADDLAASLRKETSLNRFNSGLFALLRFDAWAARDALHDRIKMLDVETDSTQRHGTARRTGSSLFVTDRRRDDVVDLGGLFRLSAAIDRLKGIELLGSAEVARMVRYAASEGNLGRLAVLLSGLHQLSRKAARDLVFQLDSQEVWERQLEECEDLDNIRHYAIALAHISSSNAQRYVQFILDQESEFILSTLSDETNLSRQLQWVRTLSMAGESFVKGRYSAITSMLESAIEYDSSLRHLIETAEVLIDVGASELALRIARLATAESRQLRSVRRLGDWLTLLHRSIKIERELALPGFVTAICADWTEDDGDFILQHENSPLLCSYGLHVARTYGIQGLGTFRSSAERQRQRATQAIRDEPRSLFRALGLEFLSAPINDARAAVNEYIESIDRTERADASVWELGLGSLTFSAAYPGEKSPWLLPQGLAMPWELSLTNDHLRNVEFGLAYYLRPLEAVPPALEQNIERIAAERSADEVVGTVRRLLNRRVVVGDANASSYDIWFYLKNTVLRSTFISWQEDLVTEIDNQLFGQRRPRELGVLLE
jgi:hypothetical protein